MNDKSITIKQAKLILDIELYLEVQFRGETRKDASAFISEHMEDYKRAVNIDGVLAQIQYEECGFIY